MTQSQQLRKLAARSATAFLLAALCVFPLYIDKFSNLGVVKFTGICTLSWAFALWLGALACVGARPDPGRLPWKADPALWALGAVTASGVVSTVLSLSPGASFWGLGGYYGGCMMVLFTAAGYLTIRAFAPQKILNGLTFCVGVTTALVTVLYVLNIFNIDLIGTYANTAVVERAQFFSTLGQKNFCSGFMAFALPLVFYAFLVARGPRHTVFYGIPAFFGGLALAVVDAEGLMLGVGVAALVLICQKNFTTRTLRRLAVIGAFFFFHAGWMQYMRTHVYTQGGKLRVGRILGREGDLVALDDSGTLVVNGAVQSGEILYPTYAKDALEYPYTVPEGCFFVLGDYRTQSEDSRDFGPVPLEDVQAKVITLLRRRSL